ncbi:uncharacterized protein LOC107361479 [Tetranychus urticae]|uniref:uncharacterized protein LOC107361479 n=1 Tax=Tetranychus urticae TaxID=32264 RepID=UPI00077BC62C|nr:uncharacterized protein LOC107361479 [Tetranychus urticae]
MADSNEYSDQLLEISEFADKLMAINGSKTFHVLKKLISTLPAFEKLFCCDLLEARESKVGSDLYKQTLDSVLNATRPESIPIKMESVIALFDVADNLTLNNLSKDCYSYFHANFTIEHLPVIIPQVTKTSKLINSGALNTFICRHFLKIVKTSIFLNYPVETVEYICGLDLLISSEYQVLEAINDWVKAKADDRKDYRLRLLRCIRWCYAGTDISSKIMELPYIATIQDIDKILCSPGNSKHKCPYNRTDQCLLMFIQKIDDMVLSIRVLQSQSWLPVGIFNLDDAMSLELVHGENISDVLYDCGTKGVRIDWEAKKFRWLNFESDESYYLQINKLIVSSQTAPSTILYLEDKCGGYADDPFIELFHLRSLATSRRRIPAPDSSDPQSLVNSNEFDHVKPHDGRLLGYNPVPVQDSRSQADRSDIIRVLPPHLFPLIYTLALQTSGQSAIHDVPSTIPLENDERLPLESDGKFIVVGKTKDDKFYALFPVRHHEWFKIKYYVNYDERSFIATVLGSNIFILTQKRQFIQFNYENNSFIKTAPFKDNKLKFMDLIITSRQDNDNKIVLIDKSCGKIHYFNIDSQTWTETSNSNRRPNQTNRKDFIMTATTVFLPLDKVKPCIKRKFNLLD